MLIEKAGRLVTLGTSAILVAACMGPSPTASPAASSPVIPTGTPVPSPTAPAPSPTLPPPAAVDAAAWYPISIFPDYPANGTLTIRAVTATWFGFLGVGWSPRGGTSWWSTDGRSWTAALFDDPSLANAMLTGVAASGSRIVAIGSVEAINGATRPEIWTSADGLVWTRTLNLPAGTLGQVVSIVRTESQFLVVGTIESDDATTVTLWSSPDGAAWTASQLPEGFPEQIVDGPAGPLILASVYDPDTGDDVPAAWRIGPTGSITASTPPPGAHSLAASAGAYWIVSSHGPATGDGSPVYRSADGVIWTRVGAIPTASSVVATLAQPDRSLVVATQVDDTGATDHLFRSTDGTTWSDVAWQAPLEKDAVISALAVGRDAVVAVGSIGERRAATWLGQPASADSPGPLERDPVFTGCPPADTWSGSPRQVLEAAIRLTPSQRVHCLGSRSITVAGFLARPDGLGGACAATATPAWLTGGCPSYPRGWLMPSAAPFDRADTLNVFSRQALAGSLRMGHWVRVTGHFDDPLSSTCRLIGPEPGDTEPIAMSIAECRTHFVATRVVAIAAPPASAAIVDPAGFLDLPDSMTQAPAFQGWDNLVLPGATTFGFRELTPVGGLPVAVAVFRVTDPGDARDAERIVLGDGITTSTSNVLGVPVISVVETGQAAFVVGSRVFRVQVEGGETAAPDQVVASLQAVVEALIRSALAG